MPPEAVPVGPFSIGGGGPFALIAGPCVIESRSLALETAAALKEISDKIDVPLVFKSSYDKANRTSIGSFRGPGLTEGLAVLAEVKETLGLPVLSDVHGIEEVGPAAEILDIIQIPAFLCRQTDLLVRAARTGKPINVKKGQFMAPWDMRAVIEKIRSADNQNVIITERGASFGYNNLVVDFRSLVVIRKMGVPVVFDATHSVQLPGGMGDASGGQREFVPYLAKAAAAVGIDALFMETHPDPDNALCDGPNSVALDRMEGLLEEIAAIDEIGKKRREPKLYL